MTIHSNSYYTLTISIWPLIKQFIVYLRNFHRVTLKDAYQVNSTEKPHQVLIRGIRTVTAGHAEAEDLIELPLFCFHIKLLQGIWKKKKIWHERLLVNNLQCHTEHVRPTKTIQLQAPRLPFSATAWSSPCFVLTKAFGEGGL